MIRIKHDENYIDTDVNFSQVPYEIQRFIGQTIIYIMPLECLGLKEQVVIDLVNQIYPNIDRIHYLSFTPARIALNLPSVQNLEHEQRVVDELELDKSSHRYLLERYPELFSPYWKKPKRLCEEIMRLSNKHYDKIVLGN